MKVVSTISKKAKAVLALDPAAAKAAINALVAHEKGEATPGKTDRGNRFYPNVMHACCENIRTPSRAWPWSLYKHCFSLEHKEHVYKAKHDDVLIVKRWLDESGTNVRNAAESLEALRETAKREARNAARREKRAAAKQAAKVSNDEHATVAA